MFDITDVMFMLHRNLLPLDAENNHKLIDIRSFASTALKLTAKLSTVNKNKDN